ncbi:hypothetical protein JMJ55_27315 [Belnapia sp. T6]|uniref:Uncharacterized protein n=1 Tax=Belnapia mucosa TaxID=2804532 RepID=A0ABS1VBL4_9PROT|nr:hypothetical protein [Belnapia mucosa]MBL6459043.1 hypothetical protein [Belnapia mucosa]
MTELIGCGWGEMVEGTTFIDFLCSEALSGRHHLLDQVGPAGVVILNVGMSAIPVPLARAEAQRSRLPSGPRPGERSRLVP